MSNMHLLREIQLHFILAPIQYLPDFQPLPLYCSALQARFSQKGCIRRTPSGETTVLCRYSALRMVGLWTGAR
uniref:Uncharacterized protein n=1 Tax=Anguilla anguilla TaxID=7936 RepID=A0A0E9UFX9_ANGAN